jgi:uncharacterized membrane protein
MFFAPFLVLYAIIFFFVLGFLFVLVEIGVISHAFEMLGLPPNLAFLALLASLLGSYINIPITKVEGGELYTNEIVNSFGIRYRTPVRHAGGSTTVAVNVGGAIVPVLICIYVLMQHPSAILPAMIATVIVALVVHRSARPVRGLGIATPMFIPPIVAVLTTWLLAAIIGGPQHNDAIAYVGGVMGTLIGADLLNLNKLGDLGAPVASIGGAGTFDGVFLTGIVAVLLA